MSANVFVFGVDAMEPTLILQWMESGHLPNLAALRARGFAAEVQNPARFFSGASWPSFLTGVSPVRHNQFMRTHYDRDTCVLYPHRPEGVETAPFWSGPEWRDKRVAIFNIPYCPLDPNIHGVQLLDWAMHDRDATRPRSVPPALAEEVLSRFGDDPVGNCEEYEPSISSFRHLRDRLIQRVRTKADMTCRYLAAQHWDICLSVFDETHCAGHRLWHLHDVTDRRHDTAAAGALGPALRDVYVEIDRALGVVLAELDPKTTVLFLSSHGMGQVYDAIPLLDEILRRLEGGQPRPVDYEAERGQQLAKLRNLRDHLPPFARQLLEPARRRFGRARLRQRLETERRQRRYFAFPTHDLHGGIRVNLAGRETHGVVQPGHDFETLITQLRGDLLELRDGRSGEPIVAHVLRTDEVDLHGYSGEVPDLIVVWAKATVAWIESPKIGRIDPVLVRRRTGDHDPAMRGILFAAGPTIVPGQVGSAIQMEDFAPTLAALVGLHLPEAEGRLIAPLLGANPTLPTPSAHQCA